ncbi:Scaffold protein Nfu/NifU, N-terminal [Fusarium oxysporum f. sp. vasinfectum]|nr:Scaffold protein Nfu/NifU, N-terminal [Fusarium oxysporum f. sp. vasinfectum]
MATSRAMSRTLAAVARPITETSCRGIPRWTRSISTVQSQLLVGSYTTRPLAQRQRNIPTTIPSLAGVDALKFLPNHRVVPEELSTPFIEYLNPRATISPPYPSPLAAKLMNIDGVTSVFYGADFITVTKAADANWAHIRPEIFALITEAITAGEKIVTVSERRDGEAGAVEEEDSLAYNEDDSEVVGMIKELLETRIRPAIQEDGGDIDFRGFDDEGYVHLRLRGACRTCDSSTVTLKNGIEGMLMHYIEEVKGVKQVMDQEEEIALQEFEKFEEKLRQQKGTAASAA